MGKTRKPPSDDDFIDSKIDLKRAPYFFDPSGKRQKKKKTLQFMKCLKIPKSSKRS